MTISIPLNATFESLSPDMTCEVTVTQTTDVLITCTSKQSFSYELKVCNPPPAFPTTVSGSCAEGLTYDEANACCLKPALPDAGCTIFPVAMKTCAE